MVNSREFGFDYLHFPWVLCSVDTWTLVIDYLHFAMGAVHPGHLGSSSMPGACSAAVEEPEHKLAESMQQGSENHLQ